MHALGIIGTAIAGGVAGFVAGALVAPDGYMDFSAAFYAAGGALVGGLAGVVVGAVLFT